LSNRPAPAVTLGYLIAAGIALSLWFGFGILLLPVMLIMALLHALAAPRSPSLAAGHHRWLAAHHLWSITALVEVPALALLAFPFLLSNAAVIFNTLIHAPHPIETLVAAWPAFIHPAALVGGGLALVSGWYVVTFWISLRLLRRGLRWAEGAPAR
jgi:hypothetical protein